jgi:glycosyltransferase involved in cell wall biosynthesis
MKLKAAKSITTVVPVFNEATGIVNALTKIHEVLTDRFEDHEILIIESGSTDNSLTICEQLANTLPKMRVISQGARSGFGSALKLGFAEAKKDLVWVVSSDLPFPLQTLDTALPLIEEKDCILSYRSHDDRSPLRRVQSLAYNWLAKSLLDLDATHVNSQFKLYRRNVIQSLEIKSDGWFIDTEIIYRLQKSCYTVAEIPAPLTERTTGKSSLSIAQPLISLTDLCLFMWIEKISR